MLACLNTPIVKRQIRAKQFTQDIIDTLGNRILEITVPIPKEESERNTIAQRTQEIIETRVRLRNEASQLVLSIEGVNSLLEEPNTPPL